MSSWWDAVRDWFRGGRKGDFPEPTQETPDNVQHFTGREDWIRRRKNLVTGLGSREISEAWSAKIRAQAFFSARVEEAHILEELRTVSDAFTRGEIGQAEARTRLKEFLVSQGYDPQQGGLSNLASTGRLNLILEQNARMAYAVGRWQEGMDPDIKERFPCWRYVGSTSAAPRDSHARYAGHVYAKDDPIWHTIFPPSDFGCKCSVEDCDDPAEKAPENVRPAESGFAFDPAHAFEKFDLSGIKDAESRSSIHTGLLDICQKGNCHFQLMTDPKLLANQETREPANIDEIKRAISEVNEKLDAGINPRDIEDKRISLGKILPEHRTIGLAEDELDIVFHTRGGQDHGTRHWIKNHRETLRPELFLELLRKTIWNPAAKCIEDINGEARRLVFEHSDEKGNVIATVFELGEPGAKEWALVDAWEPDARYLHAQKRKRKRRGDRRS